MKIPVDILVTLGKKGYVIAKKHPNLVLTVATGGKKAIDMLIESNNTKAERYKNKIEQQKLKGKLHYRKDRFLYYQQEVLPNISSYTYSELDELITEVESFIAQLDTESVIVNKPLVLKRKSNWKSIEKQLRDKQSNSMYHELVKINSDSSYVSSFVPENIQEHFRNIETLDEKKEFVMLVTNKDETKTNKDFLK